MIVYNVTINIDDAVLEKWLQWMKEVHIPDVMRTGLFTEHRMFKILGDEESGGKTYSVQYSCESMEKFKKYESEFAPALRKDSMDKFGEHFVSFRTLLEVVK